MRRKRPADRSGAALSDLPSGAADFDGRVGGGGGGGALGRGERWMLTFYLPGAGPATLAQESRSQRLGLEDMRRRPGCWAGCPGTQMAAGRPTDLSGHDDHDETLPEPGWAFQVGSVEGALAAFRLRLAWNLRTRTSRGPAELEPKAPGLEAVSPLSIPCRPDSISLSTFRPSVRLPTRLGLGREGLPPAWSCRQVVEPWPGPVRIRNAPRSRP